MLVIILNNPFYLTLDFVSTVMYRCLSAKFGDLSYYRYINNLTQVPKFSTFGLDVKHEETMELTLNRHTFTTISTISSLHLGDVHLCDILEDKNILDRAGLDANSPIAEIKAKKVAGKTAIPRGRYQIVVTFSNRFQKHLPLLLNVPGFEGIRIHPGNGAADTEGCLLPGVQSQERPDWLNHSRTAFGEIFNVIRDEVGLGHEVWINIQ